MVYDLLTIAQRISDRRESLGISPILLAEMIGVNYTTIYRYERGKIDNPKLSALAKIADALNCDLDYILGYTDDPYKNTKLSFDNIKDVELILQHLKSILSQDDLLLDGSPVTSESMEKIKDAIDAGLIMAEKNIKRKQSE